MSMNTYGVDDYGLYLDEEAMKAIAESLFDDISEEVWNKDKYGIMDDVYNTLGLAMVSNFTGNTYEIDDNGDTIFGTCSCFDEDVIYYVGVEHYPELFRAAYKNITEMIDEFKQVVGNRLPRNFNYRKNIRYITGTSYG